MISSASTKAPIIDIGHVSQYQLAFIREFQSILQSRSGLENANVIFYVDVDNLEGINTTLGDDIGDAVLNWVSDTMSQSLAKVVSIEGFVLQRVREDEFAIGCRLGAFHLSSSVDLRHLVGDICHQLEYCVSCTPMVVPTGNLPVTISVGAAIGCGRGLEDNTEHLLDTLDRAMRATRRIRLSGINQFPVFDELVAERLKQQADAINLVTAAMAENRVTVFYQPKVDVAAKRLTGMEALVRIAVSGQRKFVMPQDFIPYIETTDAINTMTLNVLGSVLQDLSRWASMGIRLQVSINIATGQLARGTFAQEILAVMARYPNVYPTQLSLEVVETGNISNIALAASSLETLRLAGIESCLDDFGTGYSSFSRLKLLPVSGLKIDRSFVINLMTNQNDEAIVRACIDLARAFNLEVVAEGVESAEVASKLIKLGCPTIQGYCIGRPMEVILFEEWLRDSSFPEGRRLPARQMRPTMA